MPAGTAAGLGVLSSYLFALNVLDLPLIEARTVATTVLVAVGLYLIVALEAAGSAQERGHRRALRGARPAATSLVLAIPFAREFFALAAPDPVIFATALGRRRSCRRRSRDHVRGVPSGPSVVPRTLLRRFRRCQ